MIVSKTPRIRHLARHLAVPLALLFLWDVAVTIFYYKVPTNVRALELPLSLFGTAIALFVGFMVNASYARWWEARASAGAMAGASRSLARQVLTLIARASEAAPAPDVARQIVHLQIAYVNVLRTMLRGQPLAADTMRQLPATLASALEGPANTGTLILIEIGRLVGTAYAAGMIDPVARVRIETTLVDLTSAQGGMERIKGTPLPSHYRFFPYFFARVFCVLLPFAVVDDLRLLTPVGSTLVGLMFLMAVQIGTDLMDPFADDIHDVPLSAICRTIEIDLLHMLGEATLQKVRPNDGVLW